MTALETRLTIALILLLVVGTIQWWQYSSQVSWRARLFGTYQEGIDASELRATVGGYWLNGRLYVTKIDPNPSESWR